MATYTPFLNLEKPTTSERLDVLKINANWDKIDEGVSSLNSKIITKEKFEAVSAWGNYHDVNTTISLTKDISQAKAVLVQAGWNQGSSGYAEPIFYKMLVGEYYNLIYALNNTIKTITFTLTSGTLITITGSTDSDIGIRMVYAVF